MNQGQLHYSIGNSKLGKNCMVISRPVGTTCPTSCHFLHNGCYAEATEHRFPQTRQFSTNNLVVNWWDVKAVLKIAVKKGRAVRFHERGDWGIKNKIDKGYVLSVKWACEAILREGGVLPDIWTYTHFYSPYLIKNLGSYIRIYASVHSLKQQRRAEKAGFKHFAWIDTDGLIARHKSGGNPEAPKLVVLNNQKYMVCPEMRQGREKITCTGTNDSKVCDLCVRGLANVVFLEH